MLKNLIVLPDGSEIFSGLGTSVALKSVKFTDCVNSESEITIGSACSNCLEATIISPAGELSIAAGTEVKYYKVDEEGNRYKVGLFTLEKPTKSSTNIYKITAYDRMSWADKDVTDWLAGLTGWPYKLFDFAKIVAAECSLNLANTSLLNGDFEVKKVEAEGITARKLIRWIGELSACYGHITTEGELEFTWYKDCQVGIGPSDGIDENGNQLLAYYQGKLSFEDFQIGKIDKVQIKQSNDDVGVIWPDSEGTNAYVIQNNYLVSAETEDELRPIAQNIYTVLEAVQYTPCKVSVQSNTYIRAGNIISVKDINGSTIKMYVMKREESGQKDTYEATGSRSRSSVTEINRQSYRRLEGKVLEVTKSVEGLKVTNKNLEGKVAELSLDVVGFKTEVSNKYATQSSVSESVDNLQKQIDGAIETYTGDEVPTLANSPAFDWSDDAEKDTHIGDLYVVNSDGGDYAGFYYRFEKAGTTYQWTLLKDNEITKALQDAKEANDKAQSVADDLASNYSTTAETKSLIEQTADSIKTEVSKIYVTHDTLNEYSTTEETKTLIEQTADKINLTIESEINSIQIGGTNLIRNSAQLTGSGTGWAWGNLTGTGKTRKLLEGSENIYGMYIERSGLTAEAYTQFQYTHGNATNRTLNVGDTFTASVWYYCDSTKTEVDGRGVSFSIQSFNTSNVQVNGSYGKYISQSAVVYDKWTRIESTFTITQDTEYYIRLIPNLYLNGNVIFTKPKLETGTKATSYSPSPDDANAKIVSLESQTVGGRNLLLGTATAFEIDATDDITSVNSSKQYNYSPVVTADPKAFLLSLKNGQALCLSFDIDFPKVYNNASVTGLSYSRVGAAFGFKVTHTDGTSKTWYGTHSGPSVLTNKDNLGINSLQSLTSTETSIVGHYAGYTIPTKATNLIDFYANPDDYTVEVITPFVDCRAYTTGGYIKNMMLEVGTMPSDWQEAPEEKVSTDKIISAINLSKEGAKISGDKVELQGEHILLNGDTIIGDDFVLTADHIKVEDLAALGAKIAGFDIVENAITCEVQHAEVGENPQITLYYNTKNPSSYGYTIYGYPGIVQYTQGYIPGSGYYTPFSVELKLNAPSGLTIIKKIYNQTQSIPVAGSYTDDNIYSTYTHQVNTGVVADEFNLSTDSVMELYAKLGINMTGDVKIAALTVDSFTHSDNTDWQAIRGTSIQGTGLAEPSVGNELKYRKHNGRIEVKGNIGLTSYNASATLFTLPAEHRATTSNVRYHMCAATANYIARVRYNPGTGIFVCEWITDFVTGAHPTTGSAVAWISLDIDYPLN